VVFIERTDGGKWNKTLFLDNETGIIDVLFLKKFQYSMQRLG
jgi:hypothetical protein